MPTQLRFGRHCLWQCNTCLHSINVAWNIFAYVEHTAGLGVSGVEFGLHWIHRIQGGYTFDCMCIPFTHTHTHTDTQTHIYRHARAPPEALIHYERDRLRTIVKPLFCQRNDFPSRKYRTVDSNKWINHVDSRTLTHTHIHAYTHTQTQSMWFVVNLSFRFIIVGVWFAPRPRGLGGGSGASKAWVLYCTPSHSQLGAVLYARLDRRFFSVHSSPLCCCCFVFCSFYSAVVCLILI